MYLFEKPKIAELSWVKDFMKPKGLSGSDRAFGTFALWIDSYHTMLANYGGIPIIRFGSGTFYYYVPFYLEQTSEMMRFCAQDAQNEGKAFYFSSIREDDLPYLDSLFPGKLEFSPQRDQFDYIYKTEKLALLPGRKLHAKRNHINRFRSLYSYEYFPLDSKNKDVCLEIMDEWTTSNETNAQHNEERRAIEYALEYFEQFDLIGGYVAVSGKPAAFTIAEILNETEVDAHFEKALSEYEGVYSVINQEFAKSILGKYEYINREEDLGIEGLRKSKLSYEPDILLKKYTARIREGMRLD